MGSATKSECRVRSQIMTEATLETTDLSAIVPPPTEAELVCDDGIPMETYRHKLQMDLLVYPLNTRLVLGQGEGFVGGNMFVYFSPDQVRNQDYRGPDMFVVKAVPVKERKAWVCWQEGKAPDVVIELLSASTAQRDKTEKKLIYQNQLRIPEYFWYDPYNPQDLAGFSLQSGSYHPIAPTTSGGLISQQLDLILVRWTGRFQEVEAEWLRWATLSGELLPTDQELAIAAQQQAETAQQQAEAAQQQAETAQQQAEAERQRAARLAKQLRQLGVEPE
jgi:Uma2 family endonuclease